MCGFLWRFLERKIFGMVLCFEKVPRQWPCLILDGPSACFCVCKRKLGGICEVK